MSTQPLTRIPPILTLHGSHVTLRTPTQTDDSKMREMLSDVTTMKHLRFMTHELQGGWTLAEVAARRERQISGQQDSSALVLHIHVVDPVTGAENLAGSTGFTSVDMTHLNAFCGIILHHEYWSRGVATEAFYLVLRYAFETLGLHRVAFETTEGNEGMRGWLERVAGVKVEGVRKEVLRVQGEWVDSWDYAIFEDDWKSGLKKALEERMAKRNGEEVQSLLERMSINW
ncbi:acyl-CoA N-acyltransferase [Jimgerdemannia flammicorona]|uniref:Acyl-CoA N-acyltransferase n=1 Tax=Jimgerdemannia flammicorona TaxID=994334 RepID=A0A433QIK7_9FUNG|nr:acyl-CoA N-acyltransferase [Jimgerdemannia flammicorona]